MHLLVVLLMFSLVSVCSWAHRSYTDTRPRKRSSEDTQPYKRSSGDTQPYKRSSGDTQPYKRSSGDTQPYKRSSGDTQPYKRSSGDTQPYKRSSGDRCGRSDTVPCNNTGGAYIETTRVCRSTTCAYNGTNAGLYITNDLYSTTEHPAVSSQIDVNAFGTSLSQRFYIYEADYSNITFTLDATHEKHSFLKMWSNNCSVSGFWQNSNDAGIKCSSSDLILEGKGDSSLALLDVKDSNATVTVDNSSVQKIWIQNSSLTLDIISSNNIILNIANCIIPKRVSLSHPNINITAQDQKECDQHLVHPHTITTTTSTTTTTTTTPPTTKTLYYNKDGIMHIYYYYCDWAPLWVRAGLATKGCLMVGALLGIIAFFKYNMPAWRKEYAWMRQTEKELGLR